MDNIILNLHHGSLRFLTVFVSNQLCPSAYLVRREASADDKAMIDRAAKREFQLLESLPHPGILRVYTLSEHELGPALVLEHDPQAIRLDHYLRQRQVPLSIDVQLDLMRQIAEAIRLAHEQ